MSEHAEIVEGAHCLLRVMDQQFWVRVTETGEDAIRVSFPGHDYPIEGMPIELEVHEEGGYRLYQTSMTSRGPGLDDGIILAQPEEQLRRTHRAAIRVDSELPATVKDQVSLKKYPATLVNLSQGGARFFTEAPFDFDSTVELTLELPDEPVYTLLGQVRHVDATHGATQRNIGVRFISPDANASKAIEQYIVTQLRTLYPSM